MKTFAKVLLGAAVAAVGFAANVELPSNSPIDKMDFANMPEFKDVVDIVAKHPKTVQTFERVFADGQVTDEEAAELDKVSVGLQKDLANNPKVAKQLQDLGEALIKQQEQKESKLAEFTKTVEEMEQAVNSDPSFVAQLEKAAEDGVIDKQEEVALEGAAPASVLEITHRMQELLSDPENEKLLAEQITEETLTQIFSLVDYFKNLTPKQQEALETATKSAGEVNSPNAEMVNKVFPPEISAIFENLAEKIRVPAFIQLLLNNQDLVIKKVMDKVPESMKPEALKFIQNLQDPTFIKTQLKMLIEMISKNNPQVAEQAREWLYSAMPLENNKA